MNFASLHFDTYKVVNLLTSRGFTKEQAEGIMETVQEVSISGVASKEDLQEAKNTLQAEIQDFRNSLQVEIKDARAEIQDVRTDVQRVANDNLRFQIIQTIAIVTVMVALFGILFASINGTF